MFQPISDNKALSEKIISQITDAVARGDLKPGDRLPTERDLASQFHVSRTVIRDAVKTLSGRGILNVRHGVGIFVAQPSESELDVTSRILQQAALQDLFDIRKLLEAEGAAWAAQRRQPHHLERLRSIVADARQHTDQPEALSQRDAQFHMAIAEASRNLVMVKVMMALLDLLEKSRQDSLRIPGRAVASLDQHEEIADAIEKRDPERAKQAMLEHLDAVEQSIRRLYQKP